MPSYKRLTLMMRDPERLKALLLHPTRPIQIVVAGKSHPADDGGKKLIQQLVRFTDDPDVRHRIVFLPDYDIAMAQNLYPGCDVWLNNPLRPLEACGTSGMKAALNGCLNLSILDGWWDEMYDGQNGWAIPTADGVEDPDRRDDLEAAALYDLIEHQVTGRFYDRDGDGNPPRWLAMVRHTLTHARPQGAREPDGPRLRHPALHAGRARRPDRRRTGLRRGRRARRPGRTGCTKAWPAVRVDHVETSAIERAPSSGRRSALRVFVSLGDADPGRRRVEVVHGRVDDTDRLVAPSTTVLDRPRSTRTVASATTATLTLERAGSFGYTVRVLPQQPVAGQHAPR